MRSTLTAHRLGELGEQTAREWCVKHGLAILATNYRAPGSREEIDIIAQSTAGEIVFIEVKTRRSVNSGWPEDAVTLHKQQAIRRVALQWLDQQREKNPDFGYPQLRFDVLALLGSPSAGFNITQYRGAFA